MEKENKDLRNMVKEAKISQQQKKSYEDGMVQATVNGVKNMFPLSVVVVRVDDKKIPLGELIKSLFTEIGNLKKELETLKQANEKLVEEIKGGASL